MVLNDKEREILRMAEEAREKEWLSESFLGGLFLGKLNEKLIFPYPSTPEEEKEFGDRYAAEVKKFLKENVDADEIDESGNLPAEAIEGLKKLGCLKMKIAKKYGGLEFSQKLYNRMMGLVGSHCNSTAVFLTAHQSIGAANPLKLFGTEEQKNRYLPRIAAGAISAFALTEEGAGSDPSNIQSRAELSADGSHYILNGEKLWASNGLIADVIVTVAQTAPKIVNGEPQKQLTAFIVETSWPGFEVVRRCDFSGGRGIMNGIFRFTDVKVPRENVLGKEGMGLKIALTNLNTGRITLAAICCGIARHCLNIARRHAKERIQWGKPIGKHKLIADKISRVIASNLFAMESLAYHAASLMDAGRDVRLEAAAAKLFCSEAAWRIADETVQIRGGRGYEKTRSLKARGVKPFPAERLLRDVRIKRIVEGPSEIQHLIIAREAVDLIARHLNLQFGESDFSLSLAQKLEAAFRLARRYAELVFVNKKSKIFAEPHRNFIAESAEKLAKTVIKLAARHREKLYKEQLQIARLADISVELYAAALCVSRAEASGTEEELWLMRLFCRESEKRVKILFEEIENNNDELSWKISQDILDGKYLWLERDIVEID